MRRLLPVLLHAVLLATLPAREAAAVDTAAVDTAAVDTAAVDTAAAMPAFAPGPYRVGLRVRQQYDRTRVYQRPRNPVTAQATNADRARPLQTLVWYPAVGPGTALAYRDYLATVATEEEFSRTADQVRRATDLVADAGGARPQRALQSPMRALRNAAERPGKFPVVIYAPSHSAYAIENADLCEYLASHGYIVLATPSLGARAHAMTADLEGAEAQAADIGFLVGYAHTLAQADTGRIAVIGYSWGSLASVLAAARDDRIRALVGLDGSLRSAFEYVNGGPRAARYVTPESLGIPMLYLTRLSGAGQEQAAVGADLLARLRYADVYLATLDTASHTDFSSWSLRMAPDTLFAGRSRAQGAQAYGAMARTVERFLDARLRNDAPARRQLDADLAADSPPPGLVSFALRRAAGAPPTLDTLLEQIGQQGFEHIGPIYDRLHAQNPDLALDPLQAHDWGMKLLRERRPLDAMQVLRLGVRLYPERFDFLYDGLGQACEAAGERDAAIVNYRQALALEPGQAHARERLGALGAAGDR